jgi:hypothetical protein
MCHNLYVWLVLTPVFMISSEYSNIFLRENQQMHQLSIQFVNYVW